MRSLTLHFKAGFTLIELMVTIGILALLAGVSIPIIMNQLSAANASVCKSNLTELYRLGHQYSQDRAHRNILPTSGMDDDEDTENIDESEGWWCSVAPLMDSFVFPEEGVRKMEISPIFHCSGDKRANIEGLTTIVADPKNISYVSWTDGSEDADNPNSAIRITKQRLDELPWLSDGTPVKGQSVRDLASFKKMVLPALNRHGKTIVVAYASGRIEEHDIDEESSMGQQFAKVAPWIAENAKTSKRASLRSRN